MKYIYQLTKIQIWTFLMYSYIIFGELTIVRSNPLQKYKIFNFHIWSFVTKNLMKLLSCDILM
jgi:hypothetical protein